MLQQVGYTGKFFRENVHLTDLIEKTLIAMEYELVEVERTPAGLSRVYTDQVENGVVIEDCEKVSHQLTCMFGVENVNYEQLEISSPGLGRPLRALTNFTRFTDLEAKVTLRLPVNEQKNLAGTVQTPTGEPGQERVGLEFEGKEGPALLEFALPRLDRARLVSVLGFKGNRSKGNKQ